MAGNGRIVAAGAFQDSGLRSAALYVITPNGTLDTSRRSRRHRDVEPGENGGQARGVAVRPTERSSRVATLTGRRTKTTGFVLRYAGFGAPPARCRRAPSTPRRDAADLAAADLPAGDADLRLPRRRRPRRTPAPPPLGVRRRRRAASDHPDGRRPSPVGTPAAASRVRLTRVKISRTSLRPEAQLDAELQPLASRLGQPAHAGPAARASGSVGGAWRQREERASPSCTRYVTLTGSRRFGAARGPTASRSARRSGSASSRRSSTGLFCGRPAGTRDC